MSSHTADFWFIEIAMSERERSFAALEEEMDTFQPRPLAEFDAKKREMFEQLKMQNPHKSVDDLGWFVDRQIANAYSAGMQFNSQFMELACLQIDDESLRFQIATLLTKGNIALG